MVMVRTIDIVALLAMITLSGASSIKGPIGRGDVTEYILPLQHMNTSVEVNYKHCYKIQTETFTKENEKKKHNLDIILCFKDDDGHELSTIQVSLKKRRKRKFFRKIYLSGATLYYNPKNDCAVIRCKKDNDGMQESLKITFKNSKINDETKRQFLKLVADEIALVNSNKKSPVKRSGWTHNNKSVDVETNEEKTRITIKKKDGTYSNSFERMAAKKAWSFKDGVYTLELLTTYLSPRAKGATMILKCDDEEAWTTFQNDSNIDHWFDLTKAERAIVKRIASTA